MGDVGPPRCLLTAGGVLVDGGAALGLTVAEPLGLAGTGGWSLELVDLDADGFEDLVQSSGPFGGNPDGSDAHVREATGEWPDLVWQGSADGFADVTAEMGFGDLRPHYGLVVVDTTGDGYPEVVVHGPQGAPALYDNPCGENAWLTVDFEGSWANPDAWGVQVLAVAGGRTRTREMSNLRARAQGPSELYFGLGAVDRVDQLVVIWPGGERVVFEDLPVRARVTVRHPDAG